MCYTQKMSTSLRPGTLKQQNVESFCNTSPACRPTRWVFVEKKHSDSSMEANTAPSWHLCKTLLLNFWASI